MRSNSKKLFTIAAFICFPFACVSVQEVESEPEVGGVISEYPPKDPEARVKSMQIMQMTCGSKKPKIVKEGKVKVGSTSSTSSETTPEEKKSTNLFTGVTKTRASESTTSTTTTQDITEWRITYKCQ